MPAVGRRDFLWMLAAILAERPGKARAQPADMPTIGFLSTRSRDESKELTPRFSLVSRRRVSLRGITSRSNTDGQNSCTIGCHPLDPS